MSSSLIEVTSAAATMMTASSRCRIDSASSVCRIGARSNSIRSGSYSASIRSSSSPTWLICMSSDGLRCGRALVAKQRFGPKPTAQSLNQTRPDRTENRLACGTMPSIPAMDGRRRSVSSSMVRSSGLRAKEKARFSATVLLPQPIRGEVTPMRRQPFVRMWCNTLVRSMSKGAALVPPSRVTTSARSSCWRVRSTWVRSSQRAAISSGWERRIGVLAAGTAPGGMAESPSPRAARALLIASLNRSMIAPFLLFTRLRPAGTASTRPRGPRTCAAGSHPAARNSHERNKGPRSSDRRRRTMPASPA